MRKKILRLSTSASLFAALLFCGTFARAQDQNQDQNQNQNQGQPPPPQSVGPVAGQDGQEQFTGHERHPMDPDRMLARMTRRYNLSPQQQNEIMPVLTDEHRQMQSITQDQYSSPADKRARRIAIHENADARIKAFLNHHQKKEFERDQARMRERMKQREENGGAPPQYNNAPPPQ